VGGVFGRGEGDVIIDIPYNNETTKERSTNYKLQKCSYAKPSADVGRA
jgi:hypothetical protein